MQASLCGRTRMWCGCIATWTGGCRRLQQPVGRPLQRHRSQPTQAHGRPVLGCGTGDALEYYDSVGGVVKLSSRPHAPGPVPAATPAASLVALHPTGCREARHTPVHHLPHDPQVIHQYKCEAGIPTGPANIITITVINRYTG